MQDLRSKMKQNIMEGVFPYSETFLVWVASSTLMGLCCGAVGAMFSHLVAWATRTRMATPWLLWLLPVGGLVIVFLYEICGMKTDRGTNAIIESAREGKRAPLRLTPLIIMATTVTHLLGGSAGREGAALQIGGSMGGWLGEKLHLNEQSRHFMVLAGMSGVFSALFSTPLAATIFSVEVISVGVIYHAALLPCAISSLVAYGTALLLGTTPERFVIHQVSPLGFDNAWKVLLLGVGCAVVGILFCTAMHTASHLYQEHFKNQYVRVLVGSALIIVLTLLYGTRAYNGAGMNIIEKAVTEGVLVHPLAFLFKMLLTAVTLGCGFRGGEIVPTFFVGATFGCLVGPMLGLDPGLSAALALVSTFCAVTNCPFASIALGVELFGSEALLMYLLVCAVSFLLSGNYSLYASQDILYDRRNHSLLTVK